ncbi:Acetyl-coenzyme A carboxyl transferase alpha chain [Actinosynnema pretiosum subsp. pretiosum]|nr:Acetyl-coenzyme A carboxyl transferase alpha chain [Actinosynnema pretiosum subsp. pretiosum]
MSDPLGWPGHAERVARARRAGGAGAGQVGRGGVGRLGAVAARWSWSSTSASSAGRWVGGRGAGQALVDAFGAAVGEGLPVVSLIATGGSRVHEGVLALRQLQRLARARAEHRAAGLGHVAVLRDPTTGGGWAALGAGADLVLGVWVWVRRKSRTSLSRSVGPRCSGSWSRTAAQRGVRWQPGAAGQRAGVHRRGAVRGRVGGRGGGAGRRGAGRGGLPAGAGGTVRRPRRGAARARAAGPAGDRVGGGAPGPVGGAAPRRGVPG